MRIISFLALTLIAAPVFADVTGNAHVVDGDTIHIGKTKVRLWGIDAPESKQTCTADDKEWPCGQEATAGLSWAIARFRSNSVARKCFAHILDASLAGIVHERPAPSLVRPRGKGALRYI